jgi:hypothetical protein
MRPWTTAFAIALAAVTVSPQANRAPVAHAQFRGVLEEEPTAIQLAASDADGDSLSFSVVAGPSHGSLTGTAPNVVYTPDDDYNGPDSFTFSAADNDAVSNVATVTLSVSPTLWKSTGLYGGFVELLRTDPTLPGVVYAGTTSGLFKSTDGGATWSVGTGLSYFSTVTALGIDPSATSTLYAAVNGDRMYKSVDGGASWTPLPPSLSLAFVKDILVDPTNSSTVYAAVVSAFFAPTSVQKSVDGGTTWSDAVATGISSPTAFVMDPVAPATLYVGGVNGIAKSIDAGASWTPVNAGLTNTNITGLVIDPSAPATLFAATNSGVFKSTDGGTSWNPTSAPLGGRLVIDESSPATLYLGTLASGVYKTTDGGDTWQPSNAGISSATIYALAIDRGTPASIYVSPGKVDVGVFKSVDGGATWSPGGLTGMSNAQVASLAFRPGSALFASGNGRILKRLYPDGAWTNVNATGPIPGTLFVDPNDALTYYGLPGSGGVVKSTDGAVTWSYASTGLPSDAATGISALAIDPWTSGTLYAGVFGGSFQSGTIYKSTNGGASWSPSGTGLPSPAFPNLLLSVSSIVIDRWVPTRVYAATGGYGVYVSTDSGANWSPAGFGSIDPNVRVLMFDLFASNTVYAGTSSGVYKSVNAGASWTLASSGLSESVNVLVQNTGFFPANVLYASTQTGVYRTLNGGTSWIKITDGLLDPLVWSMVNDDGGGTMFAATRNGVFKLDQIPWGTPPVLWLNPADITYGTPLGSAQLNATTPMPGTFTYSPAAGTVLDVGTHTLSVTFSATDAAHYRNGTADAFINVLPANSRTTLYAFPANASFLQPVYLIAVVEPMAPATGAVGGTVEFFDGATSLGTATINASGYAVLSANGLSSGAHITTASYLGSSRFNGSTSDPVGVSVESLAESTFTLLVPATNPQAAGQQTVLAAVVIALDGSGAPTGTVQFLDGNTVIGSAPINSSGLAIFTTSALAPGPHLVGARYMGDGTFTASTAPPAVQTIYSGARPATTTTTLGFSAPSSAAGEPVTITATVTSTGAAPTGPVIFFADGLLLGVAPVTNTGGTFRGSLVLSNLPVGIHVITASYVGGPGTAASNSLPGVHVVQAPTVTIASSPGTSVSLQLLLKAIQLAKAAAVPKR